MPRRPIPWTGKDRLFGVKCVICGTRDRNLSSFERHHVNGNVKDNSPGNIAYAHRKCHGNVTKYSNAYKQGKQESRLSQGAELGQMGGREREDGRRFPPLAVSPEFSEVRGRSVQIKAGLLKYLFEVAVKRQETWEGVLANAPRWIDEFDPPSEGAVRRWLNMYTQSRYYPFRFDQLGRIYMDVAEPVKKEEGGKSVE